MEPDEGTYKWGVTTSQAYFPKDSTREFDNDDTIVEWLTQYSEEKDVTYVRGFLGRMLFAGDDGVKFTSTVFREICLRSCHSPFVCSFVRLHFTH